MMNELSPKPTSTQMLITIAAFVIVIAGMRAANALLVPFLLSGFIAIISSPPLFWLKDKGLPTWLALVIVIFLVLSIGLLLAGMVGSSITAFTRDLPVYDAKIRQHVTSIIAWLDARGVNTGDLDIMGLLDPGRIMKLATAFLNSLRKLLTNGLTNATGFRLIPSEPWNDPARRALRLRSLSEDSARL